MSLRYSEMNNGKPEVLEYSEMSGSLHQAISYKIRDSRYTPIEVVRKSEYFPSGPTTLEYNRAETHASNNHHQ